MHGGQSSHGCPSVGRATHTPSGEHQAYGTQLSLTSSHESPTAASLWQVLSAGSHQLSARAQTG